MKNKIVVMVVTFIVMILLTPVIFSKLMNSKFNTMILNLQQEKGIKIKEIEDKSSYLNTDRVFEVTIPGDFFNDSGVKYVKLLTEVKFKNLPVTNVYFHNKVEDIKLQSGEDVPVAKKIVFDVTTPDFKTYAFVFKPIKYQTFSLDKISGVFKIKKDIFELKIDNILAQDKHLLFNVNNLSSISEKKKNFFKNESKFNLKLEILNKAIEIKNIDIANVFKTDKKTSIDFKLSFNNLNFSKIINADDFYTKIKIYDLNTTLLEKSLNSQDKQKTLELLANGVKIDLNSSLKNLVLMNQKVGGFDLGIKTVIHKSDNLNDFERNPDKYVSIFIKADVSEKLAVILETYYPPIKDFLNVKPDKNGILHIKIDFDRGQIK